MSQIRRVALTIDDFPYLIDTSRFYSDDEKLSCLSNTIKTLNRLDVPYAYFVNSAGLSPCYIPILRDVLNRGNIVGNHTANHVSIDDTTIEQWREDVLQCHEFLSSQLDFSPGFFRFPYLAYGSNIRKRTSAYEFLSSMDYQVAHVTAINKEWMLSSMYDREKKTSRKNMIARLAVSHIIDSLDSAHDMAQASFEVPLTHVLLLHSGTLVEKVLASLIDYSKNKGWQWVSLNQALDNPVYTLPEVYAGGDGVSWMSRVTTAKESKKFVNWYGNSLSGVFS